MMQNSFSIFEMIFKLREKRISIKDTFDLREIKITAQIKCLSVDFSASTDEGNTLVIPKDFHEPGRGFNCPSAGGSLTGSTQDNGFPPGQWATYGLKCLAPHDENMPHRFCFKPFEIIRQMPWNRIAFAYHPIFRHGGDRLEMLHNQTAMGALMEGCGS